MNAKKAFSKTSRLSVPQIDSPKNGNSFNKWRGSDTKASDLSRADANSRVNSKNRYDMFVKTKETPKGWSEKS